MGLDLCERKSEYGELIRRETSHSLGSRTETILSPHIRLISGRRLGKKEVVKRAKLQAGALATSTRGNYPVTRTSRMVSFAAADLQVALN